MAVGTKCKGTNQTTPTCHKQEVYENGAGYIYFVAPRPVRLRFLSPPAVVEAVESVAEAQPSGSSAQAEAGLRGQAQTVAGGESDIGSTPREEVEMSIKDS
eukprot:861139-Amphidinium_carterae.1